MVRQSLIFAAYLGFFTSSAVAIYALIMNPKNHVNRSWARLSLFVGLLSFGWGGIIASERLPEAESWLKICFLGGFFAPSGYLDFIYNFLEVKNRRLIVFSYLLSVIFMIVYLSGHTVDMAFNQFLGFYYWKAKLFYILYALHLSCAASYGTYLLYKNIFTNSGIKKAQTVYVFIASMLAFPCGITALLPAYFPIIPFGFYPFFLYPIFIAYAIIKYRLMDISVVVRKGLVYSLTIGIFTGVYISGIFFFGQILRGWTGGGSWLLSLAAIIAFSVLFQPLNNYIQVRIDRLFFKDKYNYQQTLKELSQASTALVGIDGLLRMVSKTIVGRLKTDQCSIYCYDRVKMVFCQREALQANMSTELKHDNPLINYLKKVKQAVVAEELSREIETSGRPEDEKIRELAAVRQELDKLGAALCIPLFFEDKLIGLFNLGNKLSQDMYTDEDIDLLTTLANQLAIAIENATLHEEMLQAQKQLLMADKLSGLGRTAAGLAHEIKNPLAAIKGMTQAIELNPDDQQILNDFKKVVPQEIDRLSALIDNLTRLGRPPKLQSSPVRINELIENNLKLFASRCQNHNIEIIKHFGPLPEINADPEQLTQVFTNLILNAIQAMPDGGRLTLSSRALPEKIEIEISDTGQGIPEDKLKDIFEPFFTTREEGMGLGLAITYKIIKDHGGEIEVESEVGKGTRFKIKLGGERAGQ